MFKKFVLILFAICSSVFANNDNLYSITVDDPNIYRIFGEYFQEGGGSSLQQKAGENVNVQIIPEKGFVIDKAFAIYGADTVYLNLLNEENKEYTFKMPNANVTIKATFEEAVYAIILEGCGEDVICEFPKSAKYGEIVSGVIIGDYQSLTVKYKGTKIEKIRKEDRDSIWFTMDEMDVTLIFEYSLKTEEPEAESFNLNVTCLVDTKDFCSFNKLPKAGDEIQLSISANSTYDSIVFMANGIDVNKIKEVEKHKLYTFTMPNNDVSITVMGITFVNPDIPETTPHYEVSIEKNEKGEIGKVGRFLEGTNSTFENEEINLYVKPIEGYEIESLTVKTTNGTEVVLKKEGEIYIFKMPASDVIVSAKYKVALYDIKLEGCNDVDFKCKVPSNAKYGDDVTLVVTMLDGVKGFSVSHSSNIHPNQSSLDNVYTYSFKMPASDVSFKFVVTKKDSLTNETETSGDSEQSSKKKYNVQLVESEHGEIKRFGSFIQGSPTSLYENMEVSLFVTPKEGYVVDRVDVKTASGITIDLKKDGEIYTFKMPASDVSVSAIYKEALYNIVVNCEKLKYDAPKNAKFGEKIEVKVSLNGSQVKSLSYSSSIKDLKNEKSSSKIILTFTMPANDVNIDMEIVDETSSKSGDESSNDSKSETTPDKKDNGKKTDKKDDKKEDKKGSKDAIIAMVHNLEISTKIMNRVVYVFGASNGSEFSIVNMNGSVITKGNINSSSFNINIQDAGKYILRVGNYTRVINIK